MSTEPCRPKRGSPRINRALLVTGLVVVVAVTGCGGQAAQRGQPVGQATVSPTATPEVAPPSPPAEQAVEPSPSPGGGTLADVATSPSPVVPQSPAPEAASPQPTTDAAPPAASPEAAAPTTPAPSPEAAAPAATPAPPPSPPPSPAPRGTVFSGTLYFSKYAGCTVGRTTDIGKVPFTYIAGSRFRLGAVKGVACTQSADGLIFGPDGMLLAGSKGDSVLRINPATGQITIVKAGGVAAYHIMLDPSGKKAWTSGIPGRLASIPLDPFADGTAHPLTGDDQSVTTIAWDRDGAAYYTASGSGGRGWFGKIDLTTFTTTRFLERLPAAHGMTFDPFTGHFILMGDGHITQIAPGSPPTIVSDLEVTSTQVQFDQGTVDGRGHLFAASNSGHLLFVDYSYTGKVADPKNFKALIGLVPYLDDIAPLVGPGAAQQVEPVLGDLLVKYAPEAQAIGRNLEIILDASGSMNAKLGNATRFIVAKQVLADLVRSLPSDITMSLRVFSHRKTGQASCADTQLLIPPGRVNPALTIARVNALRARGNTPLVSNLLLAAQDLRATKVGTVVAITDGEETCGGNVQTVAAQLRAAGVNLVINIVGFNLPTAKASADWRLVAESTGGQFFDTRTAGELSRALAEAVRLPYVAYDAQGRVAAKAQVGRAVRLPEGTYTVVVRAGRPVKVTGVRVRAGAPQTFILRRAAAGWTLAAEGTR